MGTRSVRPPLSGVARSAVSVVTLHGHEPRSTPPRGSHRALGLSKHDRRHGRAAARSASASSRSDRAPRGSSARKRSDDRRRRRRCVGASSDGRPLPHRRLDRVCLRGFNRPLHPLHRAIVQSCPERVLRERAVSSRSACAGSMPHGDPRQRERAHGLLGSVQPRGRHLGGADASRVHGARSVRDL